jgi:hypothetical protein
MVAWLANPPLPIPRFFLFNFFYFFISMSQKTAAAQLVQNFSELLATPVSKKNILENFKKLPKIQAKVFWAIIELSEPEISKFPTIKELSAATGLKTGNIAVIKQILRKKIPELKTWSDRHQSRIFSLGEEWLTIKEIARILKASPKTIYAKGRKFNWRSIKIGGYKPVIYYSKTDIARNISPLKLPPELI